MQAVEHSAGVEAVEEVVWEYVGRMGTLAGKEDLKGDPLVDFKPFHSARELELLVRGKLQRENPELIRDVDVDEAIASVCVRKIRDVIWFLCSYVIYRRSGIFTKKKDLQKASISPVVGFLLKKTDYGYKLKSAFVDVTGKHMAGGDRDSFMEVLRSHLMEKVKVGVEVFCNPLVVNEIVKDDASALQEQLKSLAEPYIREAVSRKLDLLKDDYVLIPLGYRTLAKDIDTLNLTLDHLVVLSTQTTLDIVSVREVL